jgi:hypothetical protein
MKDWRLFKLDVHAVKWPLLVLPMPPSRARRVHHPERLGSCTAAQTEATSSRKQGAMVCWMYIIDLHSCFSCGWSRTLNCVRADQHRCKLVQIACVRFCVNTMVLFCWMEAIACTFLWTQWENMYYVSSWWKQSILDGWSKIHKHNKCFMDLFIIVCCLGEMWHPAGGPIICSIGYVLLSFWNLGQEVVGFALIIITL